MSIPFIVQKESYLCTSQWSTADTADTLKFSCLVEPSLCAYTTTAGSTITQMTPMSHLTDFFKYWRGDIIFTVRVIASKYHKGRLKISFDPAGYGTGSNNILTAPNTVHVVQTSILDIGEDREVEFTVPYQQARQFLEARKRSMNWSTSSTSSLTRDYQKDNGYFTIRVQNILTAPVASSTVDIQVWIRGGSNFEFAFPDNIDNLHKDSWFVAQSDEYQTNPVNGKVVLGQTTHSTDKQYTVYFGEQVVSMRTLLHRMCKLSQETTTSTGVANTVEIAKKVVARLPMTPGYLDVGYYSANKIYGTGTYGYNFVEFTPIAYLAPAYIGYRGSVNYSFNVTGAKAINSIKTYRNQDVLASFGTTGTVVTSTSQYARARLTSSGARGLALTNQLTQSGVNVVLPMFSNSKFLSTQANAGNAPGNYGTDVDMLTIETDFPYPTSANTSICVDTYVGAGPDFSLCFYLNVPSLYTYNSQPTAV